MGKPIKEKKKIMKADKVLACFGVVISKGLKKRQKGGSSFCGVSLMLKRTIRLSHSGEKKGGNEENHGEEIIGGRKKK